MSNTNKFKHFLLTRFNVGLYSDNPYGVADPDKWMEHRVELFKETVRSVENQFVQPDQWIIQIDKNTPKEFIRKLCFTCQQAIYTDMRPSAIADSPDAPWLITTRLDNDDLILPHLIGSIQSEFRAQTEVIDFDGTKRDSEGNEVDANRKSPSPFISLIEPWTNAPKTVLYQGGHARIGKKYPVRTIKKKGWVQVIHDRNLKNSMS